MPRVKVDYIVSFSSEDPEAPASNLVAWEVSKKKWLCAKGESSASVVLQLTRAVKISSLQIGAYQAALVEVLVGRSERPDDPYEVLVPRCVFLSPRESRAGGADRVRSWSGAQLADTVRAQRWDRVRVLLSQPYDKHCKYGLSFIHIFEFEEEAASAAKHAETSRQEAADVARHEAGASVARQKEAKSLSQASLEERSSDEEEFRPGELFASQRRAARAAPNTDAEIRKATSEALRNISDASTKLVKTQLVKRESRVERNDEPSTSAEIEERAKTSTSTNDKRASKRDDDSRAVNKTPQRSKHDKDWGSTSARKDRDGKHRKTDDGDKDSRKRPRPDKKDTEGAGPVSGAPHTLLRGAVFALSGYENPRRAALRDAALALGARYAPQYAPGCTHLLCAFENTPKLRAVRSAERRQGGGGSARCIAVRGEWVEEMARRRRLLPWQWYATERAARVDPPPHALTDDEADAAASPADYDTDDEIERVMRKKRKPSKEDDGDATPPRAPPAPLPSRRGGGALPALFDGCTFVIDDSAERAGLDVRLLARYVRAYGGLLLQWADVEDESEVDIVLGAEGESESEDRDAAPRARRVAADWVWRCHRARRRLPA